MTDEAPPQPKFNPQRELVITLNRFTRSTASDHEKEAAQSGQVAGCCDGGNEKMGSR